MQFDIRTLLIAVVLVTAFCAAARFLLWRMHPGVPGLGSWAAAGLLSALALGLFGGHNMVMEDAALSLAQGMIIGGLLLAWDGFRRFLGRPPLSPRLTLGVVALLVLPVAIAHLQSSLALRSLGLSASLAATSLIITHELLTARTGGNASRITAYVYGANALFFLVRGIASINGETTLQSPSPGMFPALALLWWMCVTVAVTLGMALMTGERLQGELNTLASRDPLTGALNRRALALVADRAVAHACRTGRPLSVLMMDLDHFKQINDQRGHAAGDAILCRFAAVAARILRGEDLFSRFGGEEFVALLPDTSAEHALAAAERLRLAFAEETRAIAPPDGFDVTVSIGLAAMAAHETLEDALRRADRALYEAKGMGRNCCAVAPSSPSTAAPAGRQLAASA